MSFWLQPEVVEQFPQFDSFDSVLVAEGELYRDLPQRQTLRVDQAGRSLFIKRHLGVGWREIIKNCLQLRLPVISAENERRAIARLEALGIDTMNCVGYGIRGINPATRQSFIITDDLVGSVSLEEYCAGWGASCFDTTRLMQKRLLVDRLAGIAQTLHDQGINHRDFYICHFHVWPEQLLADRQAEPRVVLIDLHRVQIRRRLPRRWRLKDIAGLYFSAMDAGLTQRDYLRFIRSYWPGTLRTTLTADRRFWRRVERRARKLYFKAHRRYPPVVWPRLTP